MSGGSPVVREATQEEQAAEARAREEADRKLAEGSSSESWVLTPEKQEPKRHKQEGGRARSEERKEEGASRSHSYSPKRKLGTVQEEDRARSPHRFVRRFERDRKREGERKKEQ